MEQEVLDTLPHFIALGPGIRSAIAAGATFQTLAAGELLFREGDPACHIHVLLAGMVEMSRIGDGKDCSIMIFTGGDVFLPAAALFDEPYLASGRALSESRVLRVDAADLRERAALDSMLAMELLQLVSGQWRMAVRQILDLKCRSAAARLGAFLLGLVDGRAPHQSARLPIQKRDLARRVGMSAETLSRALQTLADNGLHVRGDQIIVNDRAQIEQFCGPDPYFGREERLLGVHVL